MNNNNLNKLITEALAIEARNAKESGALGYMARVLTQATIPHQKTVGNEFTRINGDFTLTIMTPIKIGLPYGTVPRLLLSWLTSEAVRTKESTILLGNSLTKFMEKLDLIPSGGRWGTITRLRDQMNRLFASSISCSYEKEKKLSSGMNFNVTKEYQLWWEPKNPQQSSLWQSTVTLSKDFFEEIIDRPIPIDMRALKALSKSPLALDIYCWLTYRMSYLKKSTAIPWEALETQFGSDYTRTRDFRKKFLIQLNKVFTVYPEVNIDSTEKFLILKPSRSHISSCL